MLQNNVNLLLIPLPMQMSLRLKSLHSILIPLSPPNNPHLPAPKVEPSCSPKHRDRENAYDRRYTTFVHM